MVLAFSRQMFVEFTVSQTMEHSSLPEHGFAAFGGVPSKIMVDNLKFGGSASPAGAAPVFNPRYLDFARHHGFAIEACKCRLAVTRKAASSEVSATSKEFPAGSRVDRLQHDPCGRAGLARHRRQCAHPRRNATAARRFVAQEQPRLGPLNPHPYDIAHTSTSVASSQFRITLDTNQYSVPAAYAHRRLTVKAYPDRVCIYFDNQLIARHTRHYGRHEDIEEPDHAKGLIAQRSRAANNA